MCQWEKEESFPDRVRLRLSACRDIRENRVEVLDEYGAVDPAEFFAVATECFFEQPRELRQAYPRLCDELKRFYQQDPATFNP